MLVPFRAAIPDILAFLEDSNVPTASKEAFLSVWRDRAVLWSEQTPEERREAVRALGRRPRGTTATFVQGFERENYPHLTVHRAALRNAHVPNFPDWNWGMPLGVDGRHRLLTDRQSLEDAVRCALVGAEYLYIIDRYLYSGRNDQGRRGVSRVVELMAGIRPASSRSPPRLVCIGSRLRVDARDVEASQGQLRQEFERRGIVGEVCDVDDDTFSCVHARFLLLEYSRQGGRTYGYWLDSGLAELVREDEIPLAAPLGRIAVERLMGRIRTVLRHDRRQASRR